MNLMGRGRWTWCQTKNTKVTLLQMTCKNYKDKKDRINKGTGNVNKIISALNEKPYGKHAFKAGKIMRDSLLLGSMSTN